MTWRCGVRFVPLLIYGITMGGGGAGSSSSDRLLGGCQEMYRSSLRTASAYAGSCVKYVGGML